MKCLKRWQRKVFDLHFGAGYWHLFLLDWQGEKLKMTGKAWLFIQDRLAKSERPSAISKAVLQEFDESVSERTIQRMRRKEVEQGHIEDFKYTNRFGIKIKSP